MFSHIRAVLLATGTLVLAGTVHSVSTATTGTQTAIALIPTAAPVVRSVQTRTTPGSPVRAITIGY